MNYIRSTEIITPAGSHDLVSLADFKIDTGITTDTDDIYLQRAISRASAAAETYCDRVFAVETVRDTFEEIGCTSSLKLSRYPVIEIDTVDADGTALIEGTDYRVDYPIGRISPISGGWSSPLAVTYSAGLDPIPLDLQGAVGEMVKALQFNKSRDPSLRSENILSGLYAYTLFDTGTSGAGTGQQVAAILDFYRMPSL